MLSTADGPSQFDQLSIRVPGDAARRASAAHASVSDSVELGLARRMRTRPDGARTMPRSRAMAGPWLDENSGHLRTGSRTDILGRCLRMRQGLRSPASEWRIGTAAHRQGGVPMAQFDTVIRNAVVGTAADVFEADLGIAGGVITALGRGLGPARRDF